MLNHYKRHILFLGDSYCANYSVADYKKNGEQKWQGCTTNDSYPSLVAAHYGYNLLAHGYGGKSWWYSRSQFVRQIKQTPDLLDRLDAMIFCHTDNERINSNNLYATTWALNRPDSTYKNEEDRQVALAVDQWNQHLIDFEFQQWAQINWYRELSRDFSNIKQVHFFCFPHTKQHNNLLIGQRFTTPLVHVSIAELAGTTAEIQDQMSYQETRDNHLSPANNRVLAEIIIQALDNYEDRVQPLDMSKFKNLVNPNYAKFPLGNFGTK